MAPSSVLTSEPAYLAYLAVFAAAAAGCLLGAQRARRIEDADVRHGLVGLLGASGLWALSHVGVLLSPSLGPKTVFYEAGLIVGFGTVWAWLWFCSSYSGRSLHERKAARLGALAVFVVVTAAKLANPWHGLYFTAEWSAVPFRHLAIDYHVIYWITTSLSYALAAVGFFMLIEPLRRMQVGSGKLAGLFGSAALPLGANAVGYATPYLLDLSHEPIGVAAFALGALFLYRDQFEETGRAGRIGKPVIVLSEGDQIQNCQIKNYNEAAAERFPELRREGAAETTAAETTAAGTAAVGADLGDVLPRLAEVLGGADEADRPEETGRPEETARPEKTGRPEGLGEISPQDETRQDEARQDKILELEGSDGEVRYFRAAESRFRRGGGQAVILTDVTERELRRRTRESRLEVLFERSPDMIDVRDAEGRVLEANARFFEKTGYREPDLSGLNVWDLDRSISREEARDLWAGMEVGDRRSLEGTYRRKDGSTFPVEVHIRRLQMEGEDRFVAIARDTTERKRAERQRQRERDRLETLFESLPTPVVRCRVEGGEPTVADANPAFGETFASDGEEVEGKALNDLVVPEGGQEEAAEIDRRALEESPVETEVRRSAAEGPRDFRLQMAGRKPEEGAAEVYAIYTDITERKERERRLRQAETLFRNAQDALFLIDVDPGGAESEEGRWEFTVRRVNPAYEAATGFSGEDLKGQSPRDIFGEEAGRGLEERYRECARRQEPIGYEEELPVGGETARWQTRIAPVMANGEVEQIVGTTRDVTEERRRERELRRQKSLLEQTQRLAGAWEFDLRAGEISWSEKVYQIHEAEPDTEVSPEEALQFYVPEARPQVEEAFERCAEEGTPYDLELPITTAEGNQRWVRTVGAPAKMEDGEVSKVAGAFQDITERKEAERRLERRAELDRMIVEISSRFIDAPTGHLDAEIREALGRVGSFVGADRSYVFLYDGDPETGPMEEVTKSNTHEWCAEGTEPQKENLQSIPCSALPWWTGQMCRKEPLSIPSVADLPEPASATQEILEAQNIKSLVVLPMTQGGDLTGFVGFDATEGTVAWEEETITILQALSDNIAGALRRRGVEERLRETRDFYRQVLDQLPTELAIFDPEGRFEYVNPEGIGDPERREWTYGRTHEEYSRRWDLDSDLARHRDEAIREAAREEKTTRIEETISTEEGPLHYVRIHKPVTDGEGEVTSVVGCGLDVTKQVRSKEKLKKSKEKAERARREAEEARREAEQAREEAEEARREAEEASRAKSSLLANMSHEIRTPLTSVIGFAEAIGEDKSRADRFAPLIEKSGKRLLQTLDGVLNLSKLEAGQMELSEEAVGLAAEAERTAEELGPEAKEKGIDLRLETGEAGARADEGGIQIVLRNLLSNAIKYTGEGGRIWVRTYREGGQAVLEVEDSGIGMEPEVAERLFEPFRQASEGFGREYEGTGVGLAVTREATEQMGGTIEVETEEGEGSRFVVRLPQAGDAGSREAD